MASPQPSLWSPYHHLKITTSIVLLFLFCSSFSSAAENETTTTTTTSTTTTASPTTTAPPSPAPPATVLRHLQIVFRHGDRAPLEPLFPNDPFRSLADWPHGLDQLTNEGRARMFRLGQMIRQKYGHYLGDEFSPREIFARSSAIDRCLESAQLVLAGSYPPNSSTWQWDKNGSPLPLAKLWQPIPVASFLPPNDDSLLRTKRPCPKAESERQAILTSPAMKKLLAEHASLLSEVSRISGLKVDEIIEADRFHENTIIEHENGLFWADRLNGTAGFNWTKEYEKEVVLKLKPFSYARWNNEWNSRLIQRVRAGELLATLGDNFHQKRSIRDVENSDQNKLVLFSSHDTKVAALLWALDLWNGIFIPYGAAVLFELHQLVVDGSNVTNASTDSGYFVAVKYYNETMSLLEGKNNSLGGSSSTTFKDAHALSLPKCAGKEFRPEGSPPLCPLETFLELVEQFKVANWDEECGIDQYSSDGNYLSLINVLLLIANLVVLGVLLLLVMYFITKVRSRPGYQPLE